VNLEGLLTHKKSTILKKWFDVVIKTYPPETALFFKTQKDSIANPVGSVTLQGIEGLFEEVLRGININYERVSILLDNIIRIRAIQDFTPSQAISFVFLLKKVIREELGKEIRENGLSEELLELESRLDNLALLAFDIFIKCREKLYELRANEIRLLTYGLLKKENLIIDLPEFNDGKFIKKRGEDK